jgi:transposase
VTERGGALQAIDPCRRIWSELKACWLMAAAPGSPSLLALKERLKAAVVKRNQLRTFAVLPKRWVVKRSFGWLERW